MYLDATTVLIPNWLPGHVAWAYLTGAAFIAAGLAVSVGVLARVAAALSTLQLGLFGRIVWEPRVVAGTVNDFQRGEFITTCALTAGVVRLGSKRTPSGPRLGRPVPRDPRRGRARRERHAYPAARGL